MANPYGSPIWYELMTTDPARAKQFYEAVAPGWDMETPAPGSPIEYRMIRAPGGHAGGVLALTPEMLAGGARPGWLVYIGVEDVDRIVEQATGLGARLLMPASDVEGVGRFALLADPQGASFYVMRPVSGETSTVFKRGEVGRFGWNELSTHDVGAAMAFYGALFGWENRETMDMGPMGGYHYLDLGDTRLGGAVAVQGAPPHWNLYFTVSDIEAAAQTVRAGGGTIYVGPHAVPTGERIVLGQDPDGAHFAMVDTGKGPPPVTTP